MSRPQNSFEPNTDPKNSPLVPQKVKIDPKIKSNSKVRIERTTENKSCSPTRVDPKIVFLKMFLFSRVKKMPTWLQTTTWGYRRRRFLFQI